MIDPNMRRIVRWINPELVNSVKLTASQILYELTEEHHDLGGDAETLTIVAFEANQLSRLLILEFG
jgi:hypothetical protein